MKSNKIWALALVAMFLISIVPAAIAEEETSADADTNATVTGGDDADVSVRTNVKAGLRDVRVRTEVGAELTKLRERLTGLKNAREHVTSEKK